MRNLYKGHELAEATKKLRFYNILIGIIVAVWLALNVTFFIIKQNLPWEESDLLYRFLAILSSCICACGLLFVIMLPRRMCKGYVKVYSMVLQGEPQPTEAVFLGMDTETTLHYDVDFYEVLFYEGVSEKGREIIGRAIIDAEKDVSDLEIGDKVKYCTCGGIVCSYEIVKKQEMQDNEIDVLMNRMEEHIGMDRVLFGDTPKKKRKTKNWF